MTKKMAKWLSCFLTVCMMVTSLPIYQTAAHAETTDKNEEEQAGWKIHIIGFYIGFGSVVAIQYPSL